LLPEGIFCLGKRAESSGQRAERRGQIKYIKITMYFKIMGDQSVDYNRYCSNFPNILQNVKSSLSDSSTAITFISSSDFTLSLSNEMKKSM
jgi:hypothetical protein